MNQSANVEPTKSSVPMTHRTQKLTIGLDLGDRWAELCALDANGEVIETGRVKMTREAFSTRLGGIGPTRIARKRVPTRCG